MLGHQKVTTAVIPKICGLELETSTFEALSPMWNRAKATKLVDRRAVWPKFTKDIGSEIWVNYCDSLTWIKVIKAIKGDDFPIKNHDSKDSGGQGSVVMKFTWSNVLERWHLDAAFDSVPVL